MGIRPKATGENIILTDTHRELVDDATATTDEFGTALGEGVNEVFATAQSANSGAQELSKAVAGLQARVGELESALEDIRRRLSVLENPPA